MENEGNIKKLASLTIKTEQEEVDRFARLKEELGIMTSGQLLTELLDRVMQPQRINDRTKELTEKADNLQQLLTEAESTKNTQLKRIADLEQQLAEAQATANHNAEAANATQLEMQQRIDGLTLKDNQRVVSFTNDNLQVLEYVAARESKRRKQEWSISHIINFFIYARFIKGMLNGDLGSVSDSELKKIGINLKIKAKEAVEI